MAAANHSTAHTRRCSIKNNLIKVLRLISRVGVFIFLPFCPAFPRVFFFLFSFSSAKSVRDQRRRAARALLFLLRRARPVGSRFSSSCVRPRYNAAAPVYLINFDGRTFAHAVHTYRKSGVWDREIMKLVIMQFASPVNFHARSKRTAKATFKRACLFKLKK